MKIGQVTPTIMRVTTKFLDAMAKMGISHQIFQKVLGRPSQISVLIDMCMEIIKLTFVLR